MAGECVVWWFTRREVHVMSVASRCEICLWSLDPSLFGRERREHNRPLTRVGRERFEHRLFLARAAENSEVASACCSHGRCAAAEPDSRLFRGYCRRCGCGAGGRGGRSKSFTLWGAGNRGAAGRCRVRDDGRSGVRALFDLGVQLGDKLAQLLGLRRAGGLVSSGAQHDEASLEGVRSPLVVSARELSLVLDEGHGGSREQIVQ
mmetsp:Transcript_28375/g.60980  ORF Transcript_28375/g.60980 Transcript_28375/m.60980 type:complete len:205 (+) Transcript_28375:486-1100(+)